MEEFIISGQNVKDEMKKAALGADDYILRGWDKLPYAIVNVKTKRTLFITAQIMHALDLCSGNIDMSGSSVPYEIKNVIAKLKNKGFIEECKKGNGLKENQKYKKYPSHYIVAVQWSVTGTGTFTRGRNENC